MVVSSVTVTNVVASHMGNVVTTVGFNKVVVDDVTMKDIEVDGRDEYLAANTPPGASQGDSEACVEAAKLEKIEEELLRALQGEVDLS